jgi:hypothetical protein
LSVPRPFDQPGPVNISLTISAHTGHKHPLIL